METKPYVIKTTSSPSSSFYFTNKIRVTDFPAPPPSNGKKLWRVKKCASGNIEQQLKSSNECLMNSLKISQANAQYSLKKFPLRRPKNRPGMPKDFVFVDLSPVKNEFSGSDLDFNEDSQVLTPVSSLDEKTIFEQFPGNDGSVCSEEDSTLSNMFVDSNLFAELESFDYFAKYAPAQNNFAGLGISGLDWTAFETAGQFDSDYYNCNYEVQSEQSSQEYTPVKEAPELFVPKRSKSEDGQSRKKSNVSLQFKPYNGPVSKKKTINKSLMKSRSFSEPIMSKVNKPEISTPKNLGLEDFMKLNQQIRIDLKRCSSETKIEPLKYSPALDNSAQVNFLEKPINLDNFFVDSCSTDHFMKQIPAEFDLSAFV